MTDPLHDALDLERRFNVQTQQYLLNRVNALDGFCQFNAQGVMVAWMTCVLTITAVASALWILKRRDHGYARRLDRLEELAGARGLPEPGRGAQALASRPRGHAPDHPLVPGGTREMGTVVG